MVGFEIGAVPFNPDGWGPPDATTGSIALPNQPSNVPFAPFSRSEKLGRIADWSRTLSNRPGPNSKLNPADSAFDFSGDDSFATLAADEDSSFRLVDTTAKYHHHGQNRPKFNPRWRFNPHHQRSQLPQRRDEEVEARKREAEKERARRDRLYNLNRSGTNAGQRRESAVFKSSVDIQPEWNMLDQIPLSNPKTYSSAAVSNSTTDLSTALLPGATAVSRDLRIGISSKSPPLTIQLSAAWLMRIKLLFLLLMPFCRP